MITLLSLLVSASPFQQALPVDTSKVGFQPAPNAVALPPFGSRTTSAFDDFDRPDSTNMGPDWSEVVGDIEILGNQGHGLQSKSLMIHTGASVAVDGSTQSVEFEILAPDGPVYVASVMGYASVTRNDFMKVQDNDWDGLFDRVFFYWGNDGNPWGNSTGYYFDLATPTASGTMVTTIQGDHAIMDIHNDQSGAVETFTVNGASTLALQVGMEYGVGTNNSAFFDNYDLDGAPSGPTMVVSSGAPGGSMTFDFSGFTASGMIAIAYGAAGSLTVTGGPCSGLVLDVLPANFPPASALITLFADGAGAAQLTRNVPPGGAGLSVQAADVATCTVAPVIVL